MAFTAAGTVLKLGTTVTGAEIASVPLDATGTLEVDITALTPANGIVYGSLNIGASTAGAASVAILYLGTPAAPWS